MTESAKKAIEEEADQISYHDGKVASTFYKLGAEFGYQLDRWISVKDRMPTDYEVLATDGHEYLVGHICNANVIASGGITVCVTACESEETMLQNVTHWIPLSKPPMAAGSKEV